MSDREIVHNYLKTLERYLSRLEKQDADEVISEIESHIFDALDEAGDDADAAAILEGFGPARDLAAAYVEHMLEGSPPPEGFRAIQTVRKGMTKGLYYSTIGLGYLIGFGLLLLGIMKPFAPESVGLWSTAGGNSLVVGFVEHGPEGTQELLGWWLIPVFLGLGASIVWGTFRLMGILKPKS